MIDLTGEKFGRWTVLGRADDKVLQSGYHEIMWNCICDCGNRKVVRGKSLRGGISTSCGCFQKECVGDMARKHGGFGTRLYAVWNGMRQRCLNENHYAFHNYGGRGITICKEWDDFSVFREWAISNGYDESADRGICTLDRIDVNLPYCPDNCRWANMREQANNRRDSIIISYNGVTKPLKAFAEEYGVEYATAWKKYKEGIGIDNIFRK